MTIPAFDPGDKIYFNRTFTPATGQTGTPVTVNVTLTVKDPTGAAVTPAPTVTANTANGVTTASAELPIPALNTSGGMWHARWVCAQDLVCVEEEPFYVRTSPVL